MITMKKIFLTALVSATALFFAGNVNAQAKRNSQRDLQYNNRSSDDNHNYRSDNRDESNRSYVNTYRLGATYNQRSYNDDRRYYDNDNYRSYGYADRDRGHRYLRREGRDDYRRSHYEGEGGSYNKRR